jgi:flagellar biosynthesis protein FliR
MTWPIITEEAILRFLLVLARSTAFFAAFPVFGGGGVPVRIKAGAGAVLAIFFFSMITPLEEMPTHALEMGLLLAREVILGILLGSLVHFVFMGAQFAGQAIGVQMGLAIASIFDPSTKENVSVSGRFYYLVAVLLFLGLNLHHPFLAGFKDSFDLIPIGETTIAVAGFQHWAELTGRILLLAVRMSLPVISALLLVDMSLGFLSRLVPQMNIFLVGFPLKISLGLAALAMGIGVGAKVLRMALEVLIIDFHSLMSWVG